MRLSPAQVEALGTAAWILIGVAAGVLVAAFIINELNR